MTQLIQDRTAIVGIGQTPFGKPLEDSELSLACQAIALAVEDAGLEPSDIDGLSSFTMEEGRASSTARACGSPSKASANAAAFPAGTAGPAMSSFTKCVSFT